MASPVRDKDLLSIQQARALAAAAREAQKAVKEFSQEQVDRVVEAMASAAKAEAERLGRLAHEETGFGNTKDKTLKNLFSAVDVYEYIKPLRTVGILREDPVRREEVQDRKSTRLNSSHGSISYAVFCVKKKKERVRTSWLLSIILTHA